MSATRKTVRILSVNNTDETTQYRVTFVGINAFAIIKTNQISFTPTKGMSVEIKEKNGGGYEIASINGVTLA